MVSGVAGNVMEGDLQVALLQQSLGNEAKRRAEAKIMIQNLCSAAVTAAEAVGRLCAKLQDYGGPRSPIRRSSIWLAW